jgi:hypothetical protein
MSNAGSFAIFAAVAQKEKPQWATRGLHFVEGAWHGRRRAAALDGRNA